MSKDKKLILSRMVLVLHSMLFLLSGIDYVGSDKFIYGVLQLLAAAVNLIMFIRLGKEKGRMLLTYLVLGMNVIVTLTIAFEYYLSNKVYIQYAWLLAAILSLIALIITIKKRNTTL